VSEARPRPSAIAWTLAVGVLLAVVAVYFRVLFSEPVSVLMGDNLTHSVPLNGFLWNALRDAPFRFWDADVAFGFPFYAEGNGGWFHPWKVLLLSLFSPLTAHDLLYVSSFFLTGLSCLLVAAFLGLGPGLALAGALAVTFSPVVLMNVYNLSYAHALGWSGPCLLAFERWYARPDARRLAVLALAIGLLILASYTPIAYATLFLLGCCLLLRLALERRLILARALGFAAAVALALALTAFQVIPLAELSLHSIRTEAVAPLQIFPWQDYVAGLVFVNDPALYGDRFAFFQSPLGSVVALLAIAALPLLRDRVALSYLGAIALCVGAAGGPGAPVFEALRVVLPGFDRLRLISPFLLVTIVPLGVVFALLLRELLRPRFSVRELLLCGGWLALVALVLSTSWLPWAATARYRLAAGLVLAALVVALVALRFAGRLAWAPALLAAALVVEIGVVKRSYLSFLPESLLAEGRGLADFLGERMRQDPAARALHLVNRRFMDDFQGLVLQHWKSPGYLAYARACMRNRAPYTSMIDRLAFGGSNDSLPIQGVPALRDVMQAEIRGQLPTPPGDRMLDRWRVRWVVATGDLARMPLARGFEIAWQDPAAQVTVLENPHVRPRAQWLPARIGEPAAAARPAPAWQRALDGLPWVGPDFEESLEITAPAPGLVFVALPRYPGWTVRLDGEPLLPGLAADGFGMELPVGAGPHRLEVRFTPYSFHLGLFVAAFASVTVVWLVTRARADTRAPSPGAGSG
jgi:hypothetical protein